MRRAPWHMSLRVVECAERPDSGPKKTWPDLITFLSDILAPHLMSGYPDAGTGMLCVHQHGSMCGKRTTPAHVHAHLCMGSIEGGAGPWAPLHCFDPAHSMSKAHLALLDYLVETLGKGGHRLRAKVDRALIDNCTCVVGLHLKKWPIPSQVPIIRNAAVRFGFCCTFEAPGYSLSSSLGLMLGDGACGKPSSLTFLSKP